MPAHPLTLPPGGSLLLPTSSDLASDQVTPATLQDLTYVLSLHKRNADALGFLPRAAFETYLDRGCITLHTSNKDPTGYFLSAPQRSDPGALHVYHACVQTDARHLDHGRRLLAAALITAARAGLSRISLRCRDGLPSNAFWHACGLRLAALRPGGLARGKLINVWELDIASALADPRQPYAAAFLRSGAGCPPEAAGQGARCSFAGAPQRPA